MHPWVLWAPSVLWALWAPLVLLGLPRVPLGPWVLLVRLGLCHQPRLVLWAPLARLGLYCRRRLVRLGRLVPGSPMVR